MKTVLDKATRDELIRRIHTLNERSTAQWGRMSIYQMLKHCTMWEEMALGKTAYKQAFIGRIFGKMALKGIMKTEAPLGRNTPTIPEFRITGGGDVSLQKMKWIALIEEYGQSTNPGIMHPFFGKMTGEQVGYIAYKHTDHHLRQFNS